MARIGVLAVGVRGLTASLAAAAPTTRRGKQLAGWRQSGGGEKSRRRHSIAVRRLIQRVGVAGGVVLSSLPWPSASQLRLRCKTTPVQALSPALPLLPLPLHPPTHLCAACPLARHPSIDFVTNRLQPPTHPRRVSRTLFQRYAPMRVYASSHAPLYPPFVHVRAIRVLLDASAFPSRSTAAGRPSVPYPSRELSNSRRSIDSVRDD